MPKRIASLVTLALLAACAADTAGFTTVVPETVVTTGGPTTSPAPSTTSVPVTTVPDPPPGTIASPGQATVLVASPDGLYGIDGDGTELLVEGRVLTGVSDLQGGVVFQRDWSPGEIFWMPVGAAEPEKLVSNGDKNAIRLHDVGMGSDGPVIWYSRASGSDIDDATEVLYTMTVATSEEVEMGVIGGWESSATISVAANLVVEEWWAEALHGFGARDLSFNPVDATWNPYQDVTEVDCGPCPRFIDIAPEGSRVAWIEGRESGEFVVDTVVVVDTGTGEEMVAVPLPDGLLGIVTGIDLAPTSVLVSHGLEDGSWRPPIKVDTEDGLILELGIAGSARWDALQPG